MAGLVGLVLFYYLLSFVKSSLIPLNLSKIALVW